MRKQALAVLLCGAFAATACETVSETVADTVEDGFTANLTGAQVVPGPGDVDGSGRAELTVLDKTNQVCYEFDLRGIGQPTQVALYRGASGEQGVLAYTFETPRSATSKGCARPSEAIADALEANTAGHYLVVSTAEFPGGAIRGQFSNRDD